MFERLVFIAAAAALAVACGGTDDEAPPADAAAATASPDSGEAPPALVQDAPATTPTTPAPRVATPPPAPRQAAAPAARVDIPFVTADTGTVSPGMSEAAVIGVWGTPAQRRLSGAFTYLHFRNGCEASCGMYDVVILENDQVIDAIVRFSGHRYDGVSSSPPGSQGVSTPPTTERLNTPAGR